MACAPRPLWEQTWEHQRHEDANPQPDRVIPAQRGMAPSSEGSDHGLLGDLTELAVEHPGERDKFLKAAYERVEPLDEL